MLAKPVVNRIEDLLSGVGRQAAARYGVRGMPTLVILDGAGQPVYGRYGMPLPGPVVEQVDRLIEPGQVSE